jgi:hypothetical protein
MLLLAKGKIEGGNNLRYLAGGGLVLTGPRLIEDKS